MSVSTIGAIVAGAQMADPCIGVASLATAIEKTKTNAKARSCSNRQILFLNNVYRGIPVTTHTHLCHSRVTRKPVFQQRPTQELIQPKPNRLSNTKL